MYTKRGAEFIFWVYRLLIKPTWATFIGSRDVCRFYPTCSRYMEEAIIQYGVLRGSALGIRRVASCRGANPGGYDPLP